LVSLCSDITDFDTQITVYEGDCYGLFCVGGNDDVVDANCNLLSEVSAIVIVGSECPHAPSLLVSISSSNFALFFKNQFAWRSDVFVTYYITVRTSFDNSYTI
jgi:hypothetical protein